MDAPAADVVAIEQLRGAFADRAMRDDFDGFADLFTEDGTWAVPDMGVSFTGRAEIRAGIEHMKGLWAFFVQTVHPGVIEVSGDAATGRAYVSEIGRFTDGRSQLNYSRYDEECVRTPSGWRFATRIYRFLYVDTSDLPGTAPGSAV